ncbi:MAG TPA: class I SAM-dependent methyltransferase [Gaiellaceae bacterium]|nr:class I SAM-dependent methyltransferase [Gaiellaceae bacterium]
MTGRVDLSLDDVEFHPLSFFDESGRVFRHEGELFRVLGAERERFFLRVLEDGLVDRLVRERLLIDTELADFTVDGRAVLRHRTLPLVSYPFEWCAEMLRDAALATLALQRELERHGVMLQDAHPMNVVFDGSTPLWVDAGSLVPSSGPGVWPAREEFVACFLNPLRLMALGHGRIARWLLHDVAGIDAAELEAFLAPSLARSFAREGRRAARTLRARIPRSARPALRAVRQALVDAGGRRLPGISAAGSTTQSLEDDIRRLDLSVAPGPWTGYYDSFPSLTDPAEWDDKQRSVDTALRRVAPRTVLDIGSNRGWYSLLAAQHGCDVAAIDTDARSVELLYRDARSRSLPVQALVADFRHLSLGYGPGFSRILPAPRRLQADLVLALALSHHLVFWSRFDFRQIVMGLSAFATKGLLVEFVPSDDQYVSMWNPETRPWYTLELLEEELRREFSHVEVLPSHPEPRVLLLCLRDGM